MRYSREMESWLRANYGAGDVNDTLDMFEQRFGRRPTAQALYQKAWKLGLVKRRRSDERGKDVERTVRWTCEPELDEWMRENDRGHSIAKLVDDFEAAWGFRLTRGQVSQWRARNGVGRRNGYGGRPPVPIGTERDTGKGYVVVKVRERATVPMSKDNWAPRSHVVWEREHGRPVPDGCEVVHANRDAMDDDPANLVLVDKWLVGVLNATSAEYWDAESLELAVARAKLTSRLRELESGAPRECAVCGREFVPTEAQRRYAKPVRTCPACLAAGRKAKGRHRAKSGPAIGVCAVCGSEFERISTANVRCPACIAAAPKHSAANQRGRTQ